MTGLARQLAVVAVGAFLGATARYAVALALPGAFPWGTLLVNVAGSFLLGVLLYEERLVGGLPAEFQVLAGTGFLSSFTTFSTFAVETATLTPPLALANVGANYTLGLLAVLLGRAVVEAVE
ncbi:fluoride efflux transporter CrcB [Natronomonas sp. EA1]|uniref:fluoride efflux transporter CrcB n=1 Tax=Natronomonas sp. EA1 TaxID=3421655 RepID=UPI003EB7BCB4